MLGRTTSRFGTMAAMVGRKGAPRIASLGRMTDASAAIAYFARRLEVETDPADVYAAQRSGERFALIDVRSEAAWVRGRISGAVHIPYREIAVRVDELDRSLPVVVYCWGPGCNAGARGALAFARLGFAVKEMIGGYEYWVREGQPVEDDEGPLPRALDPLTTAVAPAQ